MGEEGAEAPDITVEQLQGQLKQCEERCAQLQAKCNAVEAENASLKQHNTGLEAKVKEWELEAVKLRELNEALERREIRLGQQVLALRQETAANRNEALNEEIRNLKKLLSEAQEKLEKSEMAQRAAEQQLEHFKTVELGELQSKLEDAERRNKALEERAAVVEKKNAEEREDLLKQIDKVNEEKSEYMLKATEAGAARDALRGRLDSDKGRVEEAERTAVKAREELLQLRLEGERREDELRREVRSARATIRSLQEDSQAFCRMAETAKQEAERHRRRACTLQNKMYKVEKDFGVRCKELEQQQEMAKGQLEQMRIFVKRFEEGKTDEEIMRKLSGDAKLDSRAVQDLAAAQRLVADELGLSLSESYGKWLDLRLQLVKQEQENQRLLDSQQKILEACERVAPSIFQQQKEHQQLIQQQCRLQGLHAQTVEKLKEESRKLKESTEVQSKLKEEICALKEQLNDYEKRMAEWMVGSSDKEAIDSESKSSQPAPSPRDRASLVAQQFKKLEAEVATLRSQVVAHNNCTARIRDIEGKAMQKITSIEQQAQEAVQELETVRLHLREMRDQRDRLLTLVNEYAIIKSSTDIELELQKITPTKPADPAPSPLPSVVAGLQGEEAVMSALRTEVATISASQLQELRDQIKDLESKLRHAEDKYEDAEQRRAVADRTIRREKMVLEQTRQHLLGTMEAAKVREEAEQRRVSEEAALRKGYEEVKQEVAALKRSLRTEQDAKKLVEEELKLQREAYEGALARLRASGKESEKIERLTNEVHRLMAGVHTEQLDEVEELKKLLKDERDRIKRLQEEAVLEQRDRSMYEARMKVNLREAREARQNAEEMCRKAQVEAARLRSELAFTEDTVKHLTIRVDTAEEHLKRVLIEGIDEARAGVTEDTVKGLRDQVASGEQRVKELEGELTSTREKVADAEANAARLKMFSDELAEKVTRLEKSAREEEMQVQRAKKSLEDQMQKAIEGGKKASDEVEAMKKQQADAMKQLVAAEEEKLNAVQELELEKHKVKEMEAQLKEMVGKLDKKEQELADILRQLLEERKKVSELQKEMVAKAHEGKEAIMRATNDALATKTEAVAELEKQVQEHTETIKKLQQAIEQRTKDFETVVNAITSFGDTATSKGLDTAQALTSGPATVAALNNVMKSKDEMIQNLKLEVEQLRAAGVTPGEAAAPVVDVELATQAMKEKEDSLQKECDRLRVELQKGKEREEALEETVTQLRNEVANSSKEREEIRAEKRKTEAKMEKAKTEINLIEDAKVRLRDMEKLRRDNTAQLEKLQAAQQTIATLEEKLKESDAALMRLSEEKNQALMALEEQRIQLIEELEAASRERDELKNACAMLEEKVASLQAQLAEEREKSEKARQLREAEMEFPDDPVTVTVQEETMEITLEGTDLEVIQGESTEEEVPPPDNRKRQRDDPQPEAKRPRSEEPTPEAEEGDGSPVKEVVEEEMGELQGDADVEEEKWTDEPKGDDMIEDLDAREDTQDSQELILTQDAEGGEEVEEGEVMEGEEGDKGEEEEAKGEDKELEAEGREEDRREEEKGEVKEGSADLAKDDSDKSSPPPPTQPAEEEKVEEKASTPPEESAPPPEEAVEAKKEDLESAAPSTPPATSPSSKPSGGNPFQSIPAAPNPFLTAKETTSLPAASGAFGLLGAAKRPLDATEEEQEALKKKIRSQRWGTSTTPAAASGTPKPQQSSTEEGKQAQQSPSPTPRVRLPSRGRDEPTPEPVTPVYLGTPGSPQPPQQQTDLQTLRSRLAELESQKKKGTDAQQ